MLLIINNFFAFFSRNVADFRLVKFAKKLLELSTSA